MRERLSDLSETIRVKWFMADAQVKQYVLMAIVYLFLFCLDMVKNYAMGKGKDDSGRIDA